jgi:PHD/YefM family antitoxin component YafN of YafNO toxin-antitoxin module
MAVISVARAQEHLDTIIDELQNTYEPVMIAGTNGAAVLVSEAAWRSIKEKLSLCSSPVHSWKGAVCGALSLGSEKRSHW